ncbi:Ig-like domain-containing protein, partial [Domibacillus sp. PGB-M46]|uniref:Ig-like domain-containing protein n=1 Tax=Domibacillus sp. PGB-M46 TaxID=2910255 RepID=UPI001F59B5D1
MKKVITLCFLFMFFAIPVEILAEENFGTEISGLISKDTTWSKEGSPYNLSGNVYVDEGVTLTIEEGVRIISDTILKKQLTVEGKIVVQGTEDKMVNFDNIYFTLKSNDNTLNYTSFNNYIVSLKGKNNLFSNSLFNSSVHIDGDSNSFSNSDFNQVNIRGNKNLINGCNIKPVHSFASYALYIEDGAENNKLNNCKVEHLKDGVWIDGHENLIENFVVRSLGTGIKVFTLNYFGTTPDILIKNSNIENSNIGISIDKNSNNTHILNSKIQNNLIGVDARAKVSIINNDISNNDKGLIINRVPDYNTQASTITFNNIYNNKEFNLKAKYNTKVDAPNNYWGSSDKTIIEKGIYDFYDDFSLAKVIYEPYLTELIKDEFLITVNEVTDQSTEVTGEAEAGSTVTVKTGTIELGTVEAGIDGKYSISIPKQAAGTEVVVTATDKAGNVSEAVTVTVKDITAPASPTVSEVTDQSTSVAGEAEAGSTVTVKIGTTELGTVEAGTDGKFSVSIPKQAAGTEITVTATDEAGNVSEAVTVT